jgi:hypothetical protein
MESSSTNRERTERGQTSTLLGIGASVALVLGKGTAGVIGHSYALIADQEIAWAERRQKRLAWEAVRQAQGYAGSKPAGREAARHEKCQNGNEHA